MKQKLYSLYVKTLKFNQKYWDRFTKRGKFLFYITSFSFIFGMNTQKTLFYQIAIFGILTFFISALFLLKFSTKIKITRKLPEICEATKKLYYTIEIENKGRKKESGLFFLEKPKNTIPTFEDFLNIKEPNEEKRNFFDRKMGYYKWLYIIKQKTGVIPQPFKIPSLFPKEKITTEVYLNPIRRGFLYFEGFEIVSTDPFGLFFRKIFVENPDKTVVLPEIFPVKVINLIQEGEKSEKEVALLSQKGNSTDFLSLRKYYPGDSLKSVDWKTTAKQNEIFVKEFQKESSGGTVVILDNFSLKSYDIIFEKAVSFVASMIFYFEKQNTLKGLFVEKDFIFENLSFLEKGKKIFLEYLAGISTKTPENFFDLLENIKQNQKTINNALIVFIEIDARRKKMINFLKILKIPFFAVLLHQNKIEAEKKLKTFDLENDILLAHIENLEKFQWKK